MESQQGDVRMSDSLSMEALAQRGAAALAHYGVKGMRWGVRRVRIGGNSGGGSLKVKYRPTYTQDEKRSAKSGVKSAKATGSTAKDREGKDLSRVAELNTPVRRGVNAVLGTLASNGTMILGAAGTALTVIEPSVGAAAGAGGGLAVAGAARVHDAYKVFFRNMKYNPRVRLKTDLTPDEMAKLATGRLVTKEIVSKKGRAQVRISKSGTKVTVYDREGRQVGQQNTPNGPQKLNKPKKPAKS
jgi:hypothetical protein